MGDAAGEQELLLALHGPLACMQGRRPSQGVRTLAEKQLIVLQWASMCSAAT